MSNNNNSSIIKSNDGTLQPCHQNECCVENDTNDLTTMKTTTTSTNPTWIHLQNGKEFSRLLYPNPVCFLATRNPKTTNNEDGGHKKKPNVMIISWLSATNNEGRFMMSMNTRRHTANNLMAMDDESSSSSSSSTTFGNQPQTQTPAQSKRAEFTLSVPVAGMEDLVLAVGSTSGKFGSKFPNQEQQQQNTHEETVSSSTITTTAVTTNTTIIPNNLSNRQKRKRQQEIWAKGIPELYQVPFGGKQKHAAAVAVAATTTTGFGQSSPITAEGKEKEENDELFCIQGTVAHLHCRVYSLNRDMIDSDHILILAEVLDAYCHADYWDANKKLFRPKPGAPPYLTFFGSQTFGHVSAASDT